MRRRAENHPRQIILRFRIASMDTGNSTALSLAQGRVVPPMEIEEDEAREDFGPSVDACVWALAVLAAGWLGLRLWLKFRKHRGLWWDDRFLAISWVSLVLGNLSTSVAISMGWGKPFYDIDPHNTPRILLALLISGVFSILAAAVSKTSFALTLLRISNDWAKWVVWFAIITVNVILGLSIIFNWVQCTPVEKNFNIFVPGSCWPRQTLIRYNNFASAYSGAVDILLALLPWRIIGRMDMNKKERFGAICAMSLGFFAGVISIAKIYALAGTIEANLENSVQLVILSVAETAVSIMASCIPILRALSRDKGGPGVIKLFTLNITEHITLRRQSGSQPGAADGTSKTNRFSRRLSKLRKKYIPRRIPVLSNILEVEEPSSQLSVGETAARERSFV
ncbi:hypothetical protein F5Y14DRAFT_399949 [Nemania sp. NC0429]|nr:hypothetical protein F5Y14DRAFT_399949 [Nemania sp. NC0429]